MTGNIDKVDPVKVLVFSFQLLRNSPYFSCISMIFSLLAGNLFNFTDMIWWNLVKPFWFCLLQLTGNLQ